MNQCIITAHSGCEHTENNSREYLEKAVTLPCDVIEIDLRKVGDDFYLSHNPITSVKGLLTLKDAVEIISTRENPHMNCDLKEEGIFREVVSKLKEMDFLDYAVFTGSVMPADFPMEQNLCQKVFINVENIRPDLAEAAMQNGKMPTAEEMKSVVDEAAKLGAAGINVAFKFINREITEYAHAKDLKVFVWTADKKEDWEKMSVAGVDSITTHEVKELHKAMKR